jgi:site-specific recombinase XerD
MSILLSCCRKNIRYDPFNGANIEKASSHSGRRSLITNIIHKQKKSIKVAQKIAGHVNASTTIIYDEPPEEALEAALRELN